MDRSRRSLDRGVPRDGRDFDQPSGEAVDFGVEMETHINEKKTRGDVKRVFLSFFLSFFLSCSFLFFSFPPPSIRSRKWRHAGPVRW